MTGPAVRAGDDELQAAKNIAKLAARPALNTIFMVTRIRFFPDFRPVPGAPRD
ncbi:MAG: hypothetical protein DHS20C04_04570 [Hyphococcus sp.]|nr:MAG: hypothetical protein DHS20C04_04570 [Marinicaulis sp.]